VFIDLQKAFDSIDNSILTIKLKYYSISGPYKKLITSDLTNRTIYTCIDDIKSSERNINYGVPQGSVLGPILFNLYINDIKSLARTNEINLFADDTSLFISAKTYIDMNEKANLVLVKLSQWLNINKLTLNIKKDTLFRLQC